MSDWTTEELDAIGNANEIDITTLRADGSRRRALPVWVVRYGPDLYVRSWRGRSATWFRGATRNSAGFISVSHREVPVKFEVLDHAPDKQLDAGYRSKYGPSGGGYVDHMINEQARSAVVALRPRQEGE